MLCNNTTVFISNQKGSNMCIVLLFISNELYTVIFETGVQVQYDTNLRWSIGVHVCEVGKLIEV